MTEMTEKTARRQFFQSFLSTIAALALPPGAWAFAPTQPLQLPAEPRPPKERTGIEWLEDDELPLDVQIKIIGLGGAGCNAVQTMIASGVGNIPGVELICADTDAPSLRRSGASKTILLGASGHSTGGSPAAGRQAAQDHEAEIREAIGGADMILLTAGMGGRIGTGAAPVFGRIARDMGILTVGLVTLPFAFESDHRKNTAINGLADMQSNVNAVMVMPDDKLRSGLPDAASQSALFACARNMLKTAVGGIAEIINAPGHVNVYFTEFKK